MKTIKSIFLFALLTTVLNLTSCKKEDDETIKGAFSDGMFIVNEGPFQNGSGTITFYKADSGLVKQNIFESINGRPLGNIAQSMTISNGNGYIVVNNAGKVEIVDIATFKSKGTITGLTNPSEFLLIDAKKAYVSDWNGKVAVIDLSSNTITKQIAAGTGPDAMILSGNFVFVANSGGFGMDSTVSVIDVVKDQVIKTFQVGHAPSGFVADVNGKIWVICKGKGFNGWPQASDTPGTLMRIDPVALTVELVYKFPLKDVHPEKLVIDKQRTKLYFLYNYGIYRYNVLTAIVSEKMVSRSFYSLGFENKTGYLYAADAKNYISNGIVLRIKAEDGKVVDSIASGIVPRSFAFPE